MKLTPTTIRTTLTLPLLLAGLASVGGGCAKYEFDLIQPQELSAHVGRKAPVTVRYDPLVYRLQAADGRLVVWVDNPTDRPVLLVGEQSALVDPDGESHPLRGQTIAPGSFVKLILPPLRPRIERTGPSFGIGVGVGVSNARYRRGSSYGYHDPWYDEPRYATVYDDASNLYWRWDGETSVRLSLFYHHAPADGGGEGNTFRHEFTFQRKKV
jgi:hypothetical protein